MNKNRKTVALAVASLLVSLICVAIVFASMSQDLYINGEAEFNPGSWDVKFNTSSLQKSESGNGTGTIPSITATTIANYSVVLTKPGDAVRYTFNVENNGSLDAVISEISKNTPTCTGLASNPTDKAADESMVCNNLIYTLTNNTYSGASVAIGDTLFKKSGTATEQTMVINIEYPSSILTIPSDRVLITIPQVIISYEQY